MKSELAKAINYSLSQWKALALYYEDGRIEMSNALAENTLTSRESGSRERPFVGSGRDAKWVAAMYSLIGCCEVNDINPNAYLEHVLSNIAGDKINSVEELLPWNSADRLSSK
ncbi:hypothetical protein PPGU19_062150 (plasmid) [Paraburkholderia sp. PGU19]|nr:hypothetical protein PPGU19_062150 [Paraburkholderia sp. PGU19]